MLVGVTFLVSQTCQKDQIRIGKEQAIATAKRQVRFDPTLVQVRMLRQGINSQPNWVVSLSIPNKAATTEAERFTELALVRVDANTGKVVSVQIQR